MIFGCSEGRAGRVVDHHFRTGTHDDLVPRHRDDGCSGRGDRVDDDGDLAFVSVAPARFKARDPISQIVLPDSLDTARSRVLIPETSDQCVLSTGALPTKNPAGAASEVVQTFPLRRLYVKS
jgi:hypothetical protein